MKPVLIDVFVGGRFYTQVRYTKRGYSELVDGDMLEVHNESDIKEFVLDKLPSIRGKDYQLSLANQKVFR